jgi:hypothetical protein
MEMQALLKLAEPKPLPSQVHQRATNLAKATKREEHAQQQQQLLNAAWKDYLQKMSEYHQKEKLKYDTAATKWTKEIQEATEQKQAAQATLAKLGLTAQQMQNTQFYTMEQDAPMTEVASPAAVPQTPWQQLQQLEEDLELPDEQLANELKKRIVQATETNAKEEAHNKQLQEVAAQFQQFAVESAKQLQEKLNATEHQTVQTAKQAVQQGMAPEMVQQQAIQHMRSAQIEAQQQLAQTLANAFIELPATQDFSPQKTEAAIQMLQQEAEQLMSQEASAAAANNQQSLLIAQTMPLPQLRLAPKLAVGVEKSVFRPQRARPVSQSSSARPASHESVQERSQERERSPRLEDQSTNSSLPSSSGPPQIDFALGSTNSNNAVA